MRQYTVHEVMSQPATVIEWGTSILEASALMQAQNIRRLPVVDDENVVIGIISFGDVREATSVYNTASPYAPDRDEVLLAVDEVMSTPAYTVSPDDSLVTVVQLMLDYKIGGVPVVDADGHPVGMITESDIFRLLLQTWGAAGAQERS